MSPEREQLGSGMRPAGTGALVKITFFVLVVATFAAFFVTQRLKRTPPVVQSVTRTKFFSPNGDGFRDDAVVSFKLKQADEITVAVVDSEGSAVRTLVRNYEASAYRRVRLKWNGFSDNGKVLPDDLYRLRIGLRHQGRSVVVPAAIRLDKTPPKPQVVSIGPERVSGPELLPRNDGRSITARLRIPPSRPAELLIYRTDGSKPVLTRRIPLPAGSSKVSWNGTTAAGKRVAAGTYLLALRTRDRAGNLGASVPLPPNPARVSSGPGRAGVTVRYLSAEGPPGAVRAGQRAQFFVDGRGARYRWSLRRLGSKRVLKDGRGRRALLSIKTPDGRSGLYLLQLRTRKHRFSVPFALQARVHRPVLLVVPTLTWQGLNRVDDDGDGLPDSLDLGKPIRLARPLAGTGLPDGLKVQTGPLLAHLDRVRLRYDITTDVALANSPETLANYRGVLLAGDERWLPRRLGKSLKRFVVRGGRVLSLGTESLRRAARLTSRRALEPTALEQTDLFGSRIGPLQRKPLTLLSFPRDEVGLFEGSDGLLQGFAVYELTERVGGSRSRLLAAAGPQAGKPVVVAFQLGRGRVIRTGLPEWSGRLSGDENVVEITRRMWKLLSR